jgi:hypothetical protein
MDFHFHLSLHLTFSSLFSRGTFVYLLYAYKCIQVSVEFESKR